MSDDDFKQPLRGMTALPMRTAEEQWQAAGTQCVAYATLPQDQLVFVDGVGGKACLRASDWVAYQRRCLEGAPVVSMQAATAEEGGDAVVPVRMHELELRSRGGFHDAERRAGMRPGLYHMTITGPQGVILSMQVDMALRDRFSLALDDEALPELLMLNSMPQGIIEHELHQRQREQRSTLNGPTFNGDEEGAA